MPKHRKTQLIIEKAKEILAAYNPMTVRQVYYQLVSRQVIENNRTQYQAVSNALVYARQNGIIPWEWIEDRLRKPRTVSMLDDLKDFSETAVSAYRRDVWKNQPLYIEVWLEKDALSGLFEDLLHEYGITLNVGRGYDGWASIYSAAKRYNAKNNVVVLYFGDFDPSGIDMTRSLQERLRFFGCNPEIKRCALNYEDIKLHNLPPDFTKTTDTRHKAFVKQYGDVSVELDALPADVLMPRLKNEIETMLDMDALQHVRIMEKSERQRLKAALA